MKPIFSLLVGLASFATVASAADETAAPVLDLTKPPTYGELTKAGLKFPIPRWFSESLGSNSTWHHRKSSGSSVDLEAEHSHFALKKGEARSEAFDWSRLMFEFPMAELADPGEYYPPVLPFTENSKLSRMEISGQGKDVPAICAQAAALLKVLGVADPKLDSWISSEMWKNAPQFTADYPELSPKLRFSINVAKANPPIPPARRPLRPRAGEAPQPAPQEESKPQEPEWSVTFYIGLSEWKPAP